MVKLTTEWHQRKKNVYHTLAMLAPSLKASCATLIGMTLWSCHSRASLLAIFLQLPFCAHIRTSAPDAYIDTHLGEVPQKWVCLSQLRQQLPCQLPRLLPWQSPLHLELPDQHYWQLVPPSDLPLLANPLRPLPLQGQWGC